MKVAPYLFFDGRAEEAIEYYRRVLGAEVERMVRFKDNPDPKPGMTPPGAENKIMQAGLRIAQPERRRRCRGKKQVQCPQRWRSGATAADEDLLFEQLRNGHGPFRRDVDDRGRALISIERRRWLRCSA